MAMNRGRGRKHLVNVTAAGRSERNDTPPTVPSAGRGRGRGRGKAAATAGPPRRSVRSAAKSEVVQSEGIFTLGLGSSAKKAKRLDLEKNEEVIGKIDRVPPTTSNGIDNSKSPDDRDESPCPTYETEWASDDDLDKIELYEILKPSFISDLKKGREAPEVLPVRDGSQFGNLVKHKKIDDSKPSDVKRKIEVEGKSTTLKSSHVRRMASDLLRRYLNDRSDDLVLLHMPSSLDVMGSAFEDTSHECETSNGISSSTTQSTVQEKEMTELKSNPRHCMDNLPSEAKIGKMQLLKSGKVRLIIGGRTMDVYPGIWSQLHETIVQMQASKSPSEVNGFGVSTEMEINPPVRDAENNVKVLGNVAESLLCSYNVAWEEG